LKYVCGPSIFNIPLPQQHNYHKSATDTSAPYTWDWDTTDYRNRRYRLKVEGYSSGSLIDEDQIKVRMSNTTSLGFSLCWFS
jgi:hypothetical protein